MVTLLRENRRFRLFLIGGVFILFGSAAGTVALPLFILHLHPRAPWLIGVVFVARELPSTVLAPLLGAYVDRVGAYRATILGLVISAVTPIAIPLTHANPAALIPITFVMGVGWTLLFPTVAMYLQIIVPEDALVYANSQFRTISMVGSMLGTAVSGQLVTLHWYAWAFWMSAATSGVALVTILLIGNIHSATQSPSTDVDDHAASFRSTLQVVGSALLSDRILLHMVIVDAALYFVIGSTGVLLPVYTNHHFHAAWVYSIAVIAADVGELLGGIIAPFVQRRLATLNLAVTYALVGLVMAAALGVIGIWHFTILLCTMTFLASCALGVLYVLYGSYMQSAVSGSLMGRFQTLSAGFSSVCQGSGNLMAGAVAGRSTGLGYMLAAGVTASASVAAIISQLRGR